MINSIYSNNNYTQNYFSHLEENERTVTKLDKKAAWTPEKIKSGKEKDSSDNNNDTTLTGITLNTTYNKSNESMMSIDTPVKKKKATSQAYEASIRTPIKKTKKRDCTPAYSDGEDEKEILSMEETYYLNCNGNDGNNNFHKNLQFGNFNPFPSHNSNNNLNFNYDLLKLTRKNNNQITNNDTSRFNRNDIRFQKISKSKFLQKIDQMESNSNTSTIKDFIESDEIIEKIKGIYLLYLIENENCVNISNLFFSIMEDNDLFNKITNLLCYSFFEGFNLRSDIFFKYLSPIIYLEIVDQPLNSFENNLSLLNSHIISLDPSYENCQLDFLPEDAKYIFSLQGKSTLNTPNREILNFIISIRICLNLSDEARIRSDSVKLEEIINIDFIKIKIFSDK